MKLIALYLPQFHEIPENNRFWGEGFTEWTNVKKAKKLFWNHYQPRVPLNSNYYNLLDKEVMEWQIDLAKNSGIYGFCFYHYWFCGRKVLEKPVEMFLINNKADMPFCICWANEPWTKTWHGAAGEKEVLIRQTYGGVEDWKAHFNYLLQFFKDERYIIEDNMPLLLIYKTGYINNYCHEMLDLWDTMAKEQGFKGIFIISVLSSFEDYAKSKYISASVDFEPGRTRKMKRMSTGFFKEGETEKKELFYKYLGRFHIFNRFICSTLSYDKINNEMLKTPHAKNEFRSVFVDYDDTIRRGVIGMLVKGSTPKKFGKYLAASISKSIDENNNYLFINAWNEWGESNYLEPDKRYGYAYLKSIKDALKFANDNDK